MPKKGNGEGSIYEHRRNGKKVGYRGAYILHTPEGPKRRYVTGKTRAEVSEKLTKALADRDGGLTFDAGSLTVGGYLNHWLADSVAGTVKESTYEGYERNCRLHITPALGRMKLKDLSPAHCRRLYRQRLEAGLSPRMVQLVHVTLHRALKQAVRDGLIGRNATEAVDPPQVLREEIRPLDREEVTRLLEAARGDRYEALYVLGVHTGLRQGELLG